MIYHSSLKSHSKEPSSLNPFMTNGLSHCYYLGESTVIIRGIRCNFEFLFHCLMKFLYANRIAPFCGVTSEAMLFAYVPQKGSQALIRVELQGEATYISLLQKILQPGESDTILQTESRKSVSEYLFTWYMYMYNMLCLVSSRKIWFYWEYTDTACISSCHG